MWQYPKRLCREQLRNINGIAEVQSNCPNIKQNLDEKMSFFVLKVNKIQPLFDKNRLGAVVLKNMTTRALSKEIRN